MCASLQICDVTTKDDAGPHRRLPALSCRLEPGIMRIMPHFFMVLSLRRSALRRDLICRSLLTILNERLISMLD